MMKEHIVRPTGATANASVETPDLGSSTLNKLLCILGELRAVLLFAEKKIYPQVKVGFQVSMESERWVLVVMAHNKPTAAVAHVAHLRLGVTAPYTEELPAALARATDTFLFFLRTRVTALIDELRAARVEPRNLHPQCLAELLREWVQFHCAALGHGQTLQQGTTRWTLVPSTLPGSLTVQGGLETEQMRYRARFKLQAVRHDEALAASDSEAFAMPVSPESPETAPSDDGLAALGVVPTVQSFEWEASPNQSAAFQAVEHLLARAENMRSDLERLHEECRTLL